MTLTELTDYIDRMTAAGRLSKDVLTEELDEQVRDAKSEEAARINNGGLSAQLEYLGTFMSLSDIGALICDLVEDP